VNILGLQACGLDQPATGLKRLFWAEIWQGNAATPQPRRQPARKRERAS